MTEIDRPTPRIEGVLWSGIWLSFAGITAWLFIEWLRRC